MVVRPLWRGEGLAFFAALLPSGRYRRAPKKSHPRIPTGRISCSFWQVWGAGRSAATGFTVRGDRGGISAGSTVHHRPILPMRWVTVRHATQRRTVERGSDLASDNARSAS